MAVAAGNMGRVTMMTSGGSTYIVVAEMGSWTISGPTLNMIPHSAFGDERGRQKPGVMTGQTVTFDGYADMSTDIGAEDHPNVQKLLVGYLNAGTPIYPTSDNKGGTTEGPSQFRLWACATSGSEGYGWWIQEKAATTTLERKSFITGVEVGQNMDGVGTIAFTMALTGGNLVWQSTNPAP